MTYARNISKNKSEVREEDEEVTENDEEVTKNNEEVRDKTEEAAICYEVREEIDKEARHAATVKLRLNDHTTNKLLDRFSPNSRDFRELRKFRRYLRDLRSIYRKLRTRDLRSLREQYSLPTSDINPTEFAVNSPQTSQIPAESAGFAGGVLRYNVLRGSRGLAPWEKYN